MPFHSPWEWDDATGRFQRILLDSAGTAYYEHRYPGMGDILAHVREQQRRPLDGEIGIERVASVPNYLLEKWAQEGHPVFDPLEGDEALKALLRLKEHEYLRTDSTRGV